MLVVVYLGLCLIVGAVGRERRPGFVGYLVLSVLFTPILTLLFILVTQRRFLSHRRGLAVHATTCGHCRHEQEQAAAVLHCSHCGRPI